MFSSSIFTGALALLAINGVNAGPCRPSSVLTTETSAAITSVVTESSVAAIHDTTTTVSLTTDLSATTTGATTISEGVLTSETATVDTTTVLLITKTTQVTQDTTTTLPATTTTTAAAGPECQVDSDCSVSGQECNNGVCETPGNQDPCNDNSDCLLSTNPLCALGLCECNSNGYCETSSG
ncbi:Ff.00g003940.m01.CDS01 [Fusarium sp. VM40]|nr:Ff.00g003940.m01.CDS01 [Fusarium sp. VM40]